MKIRNAGKAIAAVLSVLMVFAMMPHMTAAAFAASEAGHRGSPYKAADPAPAGNYVITLKALGENGGADFFDSKLSITDRDGNTLYSGKPFYQFDQGQTQWDPYRISCKLDKAPAKIKISTHYGFKAEWDKAEELIYEGDFREAQDWQYAAAPSVSVLPGRNIDFFEYMIEYIDGPLRYIDEKGVEQQQEEYEIFNGVLDASKGEEKWYAVRGSFEAQVLPVETGDVNLVLCDGARLRAKGGIRVSGGASLTIWAQKNFTGELIAEGDRLSPDISFELFDTYQGPGTPGIGGNPDILGGCGDITINGGRITALGGEDAAGIGNAEFGGCGDITINGGKDGSRTFVTACGGAMRDGEKLSKKNRDDGCGIGGSGGTVLINGGTVTAEGGFKSPGIGGDGVPVTINGGVVSAEGGADKGGGIGGGANGPITITGGDVKAIAPSPESAHTDENSNASAAIGAGVKHAQKGKITISGGTVEAICYGFGAGIGGGTDETDGLAGGDIEISGADTNIIAMSLYGAGIGSGGACIGVNTLSFPDGASSGNITINDGFVFAMSTAAGAGIGGGNRGYGGRVTINNGYVVAYGGSSEYSWYDAGAKDNAGSGPSQARHPGINGLRYIEKELYGKIADLVIDLIFSTDYSGAGIGGGDGAGGGTVVINGGTVVAKAGSGAASAIGGGKDAASSSSSLSIYDYASVTYGNRTSGGVDIKGEERFDRGKDNRTGVAKKYTYARIEPEEVKVDFDTGGKAEAPASQSVLQGWQAERPQNPAADGYRFTGWYSDSGCTKKYDFSDPVWENKTVYAGWLKEYPITVKAQWPQADDLPSDVRISFRDRYAGNTRTGSVTLTSDRNWQGVIKVTEESLLTLSEADVDGFKASNWKINVMIGYADLPVTSDGKATLDLSDQKASGLPDLDYDSVLKSLKKGNAVVRLTHVKTKVYSVEKKWEIDSAGRYKPDSVKAVLQHFSGGKWKTLETVTLSDENNWKTDFRQVEDEGSNTNYRVRELDENGNIVFDSKDSDKSGNANKVTHNIEPWTDSRMDMEYDVAYAVSGSRTTITNSTGTIYSVRIKWEDENGNELPESETPDEVSLTLLQGNAVPIDGTSTAGRSGGWEAAFRPQMGSGTIVVRENCDDGRTVRNTGDPKSKVYDMPDNTAYFNVDRDGKIRKYRFSAAYEEDTENHITTITNRRNGVVYDAKVEWEPDNGSIFGVDAVLQHYENGKWVTLQRTDHDLDDTHLWKASFEAVPVDDENNYRVREEINDHKDSSGTGFVITGDTYEVPYYSSTANAKLMLDARDEDNRDGSALSFTYHNSWAIPAKRDTTYYCTGYEIDESTGTTIITNTRENMMVSRTVSNIWEDNDNAGGARPDELSVTLYEMVPGEGTRAVRKLALNEENNWTASAEGLPQYKNDSPITYYWSADDADGYQVTDVDENGDKVTFTSTYGVQEVKLTAGIEWDDSDNNDGFRPDEVNLVLHENGKPLKGTGVTLSKEDGWAPKSVENLPAYKDGKKIRYTWGPEPEIEKYGRIFCESGNYTKLICWKYPDYKTVEVYAFWDDDDNKEGRRPEYLTVNLYEGEGNLRTLVDTVRLAADDPSDTTSIDRNIWYFCWETLSMYKAGKLQSYSIEVVPCSGYKTAVSGPETVGDELYRYTVTNTLEQKQQGEEQKPKVVKGRTYVKNGQSYKVTKVATGKAQGAVTFVRAKNSKNVTVPASVKLRDGRTYKVTRIGAKAFTASKILNVTVGKNVKKTDAYAFRSSKAVRVTLKTKLLKKSGVKGSLKKSKVTTVRVKVGSTKENKKYIKKYKKIFTKTNAGKKVNVK